MCAVLYARYGSDNWRDVSIEDQARICRVRADREGWTIAKMFTDRGLSGATTLDPAYQVLPVHFRQEGIAAVLAESPDRFSRSHEHIAAFYKKASFDGARIVRRLRPDGERNHGLCAVYLKQATIVPRIFADYAASKIARQIARAQNAGTAAVSRRTQGVIIKLRRRPKA